MAAPAPAPAPAAPAPAAGAALPFDGGPGPTADRRAAALAELDRMPASDAPDAGAPPARSKGEPAEPGAPAELEAPGAKGWKRLRQERRQLRESREQIEHQAREVQTRAASLEQERAELARYREIEKRVKDEPLSVLDAYGLSYDKLTGAALKKGTPEALLERQGREFDALRKEIADERAASAQAAQAAQADRAERGFVAAIEADKVGLPALAIELEERGARAVLGEAYEVAAQLRAELRRQPTDQEIRRTLNGLWAQRHDSYRKRFSTAGAELAASARTPEPTRSAKPGAPRAPSTLRNADASQSSGRLKPLTKKEREAEAMKELAQLGR